MKKEIPRQSFYVCDMCNKEYKNEIGHIKLNLPHRDFSGCVCGGHIAEYDLCENCSWEIKKKVEAKSK